MCHGSRVDVERRIIKLYYCCGVTRRVVKIKAGLVRQKENKGMKEGDEEITLDPVQATQIRIMMEAAEKEERRREQTAERAERRAEEAAAEERIEGIFDSHRVSEELRADLLLANLETKMKTVLNEIKTYDYLNYEVIKQQIIRYCRFCPMKLRDEFFLARKAHDETYPAFASKLHRNLRFYLQSRKVETLDQALLLLVVGRMKELLPKNLLEHVLTQEGEEWLTHERWTMLWRYEANINMRLSSNVAPGYKPLQTAVRPGTDHKWLNKEVVKGSISKVGCYHCGSRGHLAKFCTQKTNHNPIKKLMKCQVTAMPQATKELKKPSITPGTIQAEKYFKRPFVQVKIQAGPTCAALVDRGAEVCGIGISQDLSHKLNIPRGERLRIKGWNGPTTEVDGAWVMMAYNPDEGESIAPAVVELLKMARQYAVKLGNDQNITPIKIPVRRRGDDLIGVMVVNAANVVSVKMMIRCMMKTLFDHIRNVGRYEVAHNSSNDHSNASGKLISNNSGSESTSHNDNDINSSDDNIGNKGTHNNNGDNTKINVRLEVAYNNYGINNGKIDGSIMLDKVGKELVNENNNCKIDGSGIVDIVDDHEVDEEKDDEVSGINNCNLDASSSDGDEDHDVDGEEDEKMERNVGNVDQADDVGNVGQSDEADKVDGVGDVVRSGEARVGSDGGRLVDDEEADVHDNDCSQEDATMKNNKCNVRDEDDEESVEGGCTLEKEKFLQEQRKCEAATKFTSYKNVCKVRYGGKKREKYANYSSLGDQSVIKEQVNGTNKISTIEHNTDVISTIKHNTKAINSTYVRKVFFTI
ncbi:hypothetical protein HELRODRAFT_173159 [Helobdella robusta]|uniref:CCHC-type domain-containing protein n=1 Tax=Helobdella robusta TaxID=6412 RepID=T1F6H1_HELRO|nr:hypothetical protein HELRODRAFT_173159 [Helobdella robusta]ESO04082.1 hypothetical protein HELRODRAFT_173159 [Helobdella robusta]